MASSFPYILFKTITRTYISIFAWTAEETEDNWYCTVSKTTFQCERRVQSRDPNQRQSPSMRLWCFPTGKRKSPKRRVNNFAPWISSSLFVSSILPLKQFRLNNYRYINKIHFIKFHFVLLKTSQISNKIFIFPVCQNTLTRWS